MSADLTTFFSEHEIPQLEQREKTFLEISQQPHYENVLSNIYAFFFRVNEEHGLEDLFLSTVTSFIKERVAGKDFTQLSDPHVETEKHTKKNGRIDLLLHNKQGTIIIENKVYHVLNNDLDDYWKSVSAPSDKHKVGIILSLYRIEKSQYERFKFAEHYFNLTHLDFMNRVMDNLASYREKASPKFLVYLEDFYQNIKNLSESSMNDKDLKFYLEHRAPIHKAATLKYRFKEYVKTEAAKANTQLNIDLELSNNQHKERLVYYVSKKNPDLMFTLVFEELFEVKNVLHLFVELIHKAKQTMQSHPELHQGHEHFKDDHFATSTRNWAHFAYEQLILSEEELSSLSSAIANRINNSPLLEIFTSLEEVLKPQTT